MSTKKASYLSNLQCTIIGRSWIAWPWIYLLLFQCIILKKVIFIQILNLAILRIMRNQIIQIVKMNVCILKMNTLSCLALHGVVYQQQSRSTLHNNYCFYFNGLNCRAWNELKCDSYFNTKPIVSVPIAESHVDVSSVDTSSVAGQCIEMLNSYDVMPGESWGSLPVSKQM